VETLWRDWEKQQEMAEQQGRRSYLTMFGEKIHRMREVSKKEQLGS
jgi:predicted SpoU family rRNA methylase